MNWFLGLLFILILIYLINRSSKKKRITRLKKELLENWGKPKSEKFYFQSIGQYFYNNQHKRNAYHIISDRANSDLDINAVFEIIDRTTSKIGQQFLYYKLRTIGTIDNLKKFSAFSKIFEDDKSVRLQCQILLSNLNTTEAYELEKLINDKNIDKPKNVKWIYMLSLISISSILLSFSHPVFLLMLIPVFVLNTISHYKNKENITYYLNGVTQLNKGLTVSKELIKVQKIKSHFTNSHFIENLNSIRLKTIL